MASITTDRRHGVSSSSAIKVPCITATTANITLSGEQTIDGIACVADDRVLVKDQTDGIENGIYQVSTGTWQREPDWDGTRDVKEGTAVFITDGSSTRGNFRVTTADPIVVGTTSVAFEFSELDITLRTDLASTATDKGASLVDFSNGIDINGTIVIVDATNGSFIVNSEHNASDSTLGIIVGGGSAIQPNLIGSPTKPQGSDFTPTGWADDTGYVATTATQAFIGAGGDNICNQSAGSITGGAHNFIKYNAGGHSNIHGGSYNLISGFRSFIAHGVANTITGSASSLSAIGGGQNNNLTGSQSVILNGRDCTVDGDYSLAFGRNAKASNDGVVVFADDVVSNFEVTTTRQFAARYANGYRFTSGNFGISDALTAPEPASKLHVHTETQISTGESAFRLQGLGAQNEEIGMALYAPYDTASSNRAGRIFAKFTDTNFNAAHLIFQSMAAGDTLVDTLTVNRGNVVLGSAAIATTATDGFLYATSCAGDPTGTPTSYTGRSPVVYDSTNKKICVYDGAAWVCTAALT